ncbi:MAG: hypothetical protein KIT45_06765 [Fimbriimonadia bacterium]|nr:hypothetical protein [Fimbriimonadia bacterium]
MQKANRVRVVVKGKYFQTRLFRGLSQPCFVTDSAWDSLLRLPKTRGCYIIRIIRVSNKQRVLLCQVESRKGDIYYVSYEGTGWSCGCPCFAAYGKCKHVYAVIALKTGDLDGVVSSYGRFVESHRAEWHARLRGTGVQDEDN